MSDNNVYESIAKKWDSFVDYVQGHWALLILALFTGTFTYHAADYYLHNPLYTIMTLTLTEGLFLRWEYLAEGSISSGMEDNKLDAAEITQIIAAGLGCAISFAAVAVTDFASAQVLGAESGAFSLFTTIPDWAQVVIVNSVWTLAIVHILLMTTYLVASPEFALERAKRRSARIMGRTVIRGNIKREKHAQERYDALVSEHAPNLGRQQAEREFNRNNLAVGMEALDNNRPTLPPTPSR